MAKQKKEFTQQGMDNVSFSKTAGILTRLLMLWDGSNPIAAKGNSQGELVLAGMGATTPTIYNVTVASADTEVSRALSNNTKQFFVKLRGQAAKLRLAFTTGGADPSTGTFITIPANGFLSPAGLDLSSITLYFETTSGSQVIEILEYK